MIKIALLFLTVTGIHHETYWQDFLKGYEEQYSLSIHSKEGVPDSSPFKPHELNTSLPTDWTNTMRAQIALLKEALKDPDNEKFIFLSESTIPLQDFPTIYEKVTYTYKSIFPFCHNPHLDATRDGTFWHYHNFQPRAHLHPIPPRLQYKNPQWIILNRKHAQLMVEDTKYIEMIAEYPCDNEHYPATFLAIKGLLDEVINYQTTYDDWIATNSPRSPFTFTDLQNEIELKLATRAIKGGLYSRPTPYLFGRKFAEDCDLTPLDKHLNYRIAWN